MLRRIRELEEQLAAERCSGKRKQPASQESSEEPGELEESPDRAQEGQEQPEAGNDAPPCQEVGASLRAGQGKAKEIRQRRLLRKDALVKSLLVATQSCEPVQTMLQGVESASGQHKRTRQAARPGSV